MKHGKSPFRVIATLLCIMLAFQAIPLVMLVSAFDTSVTGNYFNVLSQKEYPLAPGAAETELVLNNSAGNDRKVVHYFEVDTKNENIQVLPGYYGIENLDPDNLALDGVTDKSKYWKAELLTKTVAYYESLGYNVVGAMNTALAYDSDAPYGYMVYNGVVLGTPDVHKGAQTYLAIDGEGNCELRNMSTPLKGNEVTAISANFGWLVKDGELVTKTVERTSSDASRSMIGIKADGTLVFCQVDGRNSPISTGLSNYEMGEMMLALGCVNAVNCDGGGSSTFVSKREGEAANVMRSVPSDGAERPTINSVIIVSKAAATGEFDHAALATDYDYYAPGSSAEIKASGVDAAGGPAEIPEEGISWALSDDGFGTVANGVFTSNGTKGDVTVQMLYGEAVVGEKLIHVVDPDVFALSLHATVLPYGKSMSIDFACTYGVDNWAVCVDGAYTLTLSDPNAATLVGNTLIATSDESVAGVNVTATYNPNPSVKDVLQITFGKGSEIIYDFEDGDRAGFMGFVEAKQWSIDHGVNNTLVGDAPLAGQFNPQISSTTSVVTAEMGGQVRNGKYALAWSQDYTDADFAGWSYNVLFNVGETIVLRDVANGKNATAVGMWLYIPEGGAGLSFQSQFYTKNADGSYACGVQQHFTFTTVDGTVKNLNSCTEADIPESRWVYVSIDISGYDFVCTPVATDDSNTRTPSFIRSYVKPTQPAVLTFYIDDITLDYSSAVDDRVLPTISDVSYTTADESVALNEGAKINGNTMAFSATIADNLKLDYTTGRIYVDGNALPNVLASGKYLTSENVTLTAGVHTVKFEIKDDMGNTAVVTRTFTVAGDAVITLGGHNDSGKMPEYDSVYYVDVNVADRSAINTLSTVLRLQNANTWEPQGIVAAKGFRVTYDLNEVSGLLTVSVERNGDEIEAGAGTLVSIPVRLWSFDGINNVTGVPMDREAYFKDGYCPIVTVDCRVLTGTVEFAGAYNGYLGAFGGRISVETKINDTVYPWHYHDADLLLLNKDVTCTEDGYTGRTYCESCQSVIDWGTVVPATGHKYELTNGKFVCSECDGVYNAGTGLFVLNGNTYYAIAGNLMMGWQKIDDDMYYFSGVNYAGLTGTYELGGIPYTFENGRLLEGTWVTYAGGTRYYYGGGYYKCKAGNPYANAEWVTIDGKTYAFDRDGYRHEGIRLIVNSNEPGKLYEFTDDGVLIGPYETTESGIFACNKQVCYLENGVPVAAGMIQVGDDYYYINSGYLAVTGTYYCTHMNGLMPGGEYTFGEDGKMILKNGVIDGYLYINNVLQRCYQLVWYNGDYYFINDGNKVAMNTRIYLSAQFVEGTGLAVGYYDFDEYGRLVIKNGPWEDGYFYLNGVRQNCYQLIEYQGYYYFINDAHKYAVSKRIYLSAQFVEGTGLAVGYYDFDETGKMLLKNGPWEDGYFYLNGVRQSCYQLIQYQGDYYFINDGHKYAVNKRIYLSEKFVDGTDLKPGYYEFGADGKMVVEHKNGFVTENGGIYYYVDGVLQAGAGLILVDGSYYYVRSNGQLATGSYAINTNNGFMKSGTYTFDSTGKMIPPAYFVVGIRNGRDIGKVDYLKTTDGKDVKEGLLIRGSELDGAVWALSDDVAAYGVNLLKETYGIKTDMDLRSADVGVGDPLGDGVTHKYYNMPYYEGVFTEDGMQKVKEVFSDLANPDNYPVYLHCTYGLDRTGTVCYLLEAVLGMSDSALSREYCISNGSHEPSILKVKTGLAAYEGTTTQQRAESFLLACGVTSEEIASLRSIFLEP